MYLDSIISFTLDKRIVIGYDSTNKVIGENDIFELSKDWRKMDIDFDFDAPKGRVASIIVYGHSLGEQDYPFFFEIFDRANILEEENTTNIIFCYSRYGDNPDKAIEEYEMNASKLLNAYERFKNPSIQRNTIITSLKTTNRLTMVEVVD